MSTPGDLLGCDDHEAANMRRCFEAARAQEPTHEQAERCDDGEHGCAACPWRREASKPTGSVG